MNNFYVVIDAGHGGNDPGTSANGVLEKDLTLEISRYMYDRFKERGIPVSLVRSSDETLTSDERVRRILNAFGNGSNVVVISNHINSSGTPNVAEGAEVIYALRNEPTLAQNILRALKEQGQVVRRVYQRALPNDPNKDYYFIHRETANTEPVIIEYGFINNKQDLERIQNNYRRYVNAIVDAVIETRGSSSNVHIVRPGDTLWSVAKMHGLTVKQLKSLNNLNSDLLTVGQVLKIQDNTNNNINISDSTYVVKYGDTLWKIANMFDTTVEELMKLNDLSSNLLSIGQILKVKEGSSFSNEYIVKAGDSLWKIARDYGISVEDLKMANNLTSNVIFIGQVLTIPTSRSYYREASVIYKVKQGDTLFSIAKMYSTTVDKIIELNNLDNDMIIVGQLLMIP